MSFNEDEVEKAMRLSMVTYNKEQHRGNGRGPAGSFDYSNDFTNVFENVFSDLKDETFEQEERKPRGFQQELIDTILKDNFNYIVFAPTGCGKTFVASSIAKHFLERRVTRKATVIFVVDRIPLVLQQAAAIKADIGRQWQVAQYCGDLGAIDNWKLATRTVHVMVVIAQTLLNCLAVNPGALVDVDLLIFDECHHTTKDHPYHRIVRDHWKSLPTASRPKIVGLTASPGGKPDKYKTKEKIRSLCENMHAKIIMVQENIEELKGTLNPPLVKIVNIIWDPYLLALIDKLNELIKEIEISASSPYKWPEKKTSFEYMRFCEQLKEKSGIDNRVKSACALNLLISNCIQLLEDVGLECVIDYLKTQQREGAHLREISKLLVLFTSRLKPGLAHGKRDTLMRTLQEILDQPGFKRGIIFVKTRASAHALLQTIRQHLPRFRPCLLVGHGAKGEGGMRAKSQQNTVKEFNSGASNLMIATSVAEEGLDILIIFSFDLQEDIQACNTVIRYDAVDTAEALIQSRGRARFRDSTFIVMLSGDTKKFFEALESEKNMHEVVSELQRKPGGFYDFLYREASHSAHNNNNNNNNSAGDDTFDDFEMIQPNATSACITNSNRSDLAVYNSNNGTNGTPKILYTEVVKRYGDARGAVPQYIISRTTRGFVGEAIMDLALKGYPHTLNTDEMYGKSEAEVKLQLNEALARKLFDLGELENIIDMAKLQKASIPPYLPSPPRLSAPPSSTPPRLALPYTTSSSSTSYPGNHIPPPSSYPSTSSSKTMIPSYTSKPDTYNSLLTPAPSRRLPPTPDQLERVDRHLKAKDKTAVSCLFEWCQYTKKSSPTKVCTSISPFTCTITIANEITYKGPPCPNKKEAEHLAAKHVLVLLDIV